MEQLFTLLGIESMPEIADGSVPFTAGASSVEEPSQFHAIMYVSVLPLHVC